MECIVSKCHYVGESNRRIYIEFSDIDSRGTSWFNGLENCISWSLHNYMQYVYNRAVLWSSGRVGNAIERQLYRIRSISKGFVNIRDCLLSSTKTVDFLLSLCLEYWQCSCLHFLKFCCTEPCTHHRLWYRAIIDTFGIWMIFPSHCSVLFVSNFKT